MDFVNKAKNFADVAGQKSVEIANVSKLKISVLQLSASLDESYKSLGKLFYLSETENVDNTLNIEDLKIEIKEYKEKIKLIKEEIADIKGKGICPSCGKSNDAMNEYCTRCGSKLK